MTRGYPLFGLVLIAFAVSCGQSDGAPDSGNVVDECPDIAPGGLSMGDPCPENLPAEGCTYTLDCASGRHDFTFTCISHRWVIEPSPCERQSEFCTGGEQQVRCDEASEGGLEWGASFSANDGPAPCPSETQRAGDPCADSTYSMLGCGYFCDDGTTWTTGYCDYDTTTDEPNDQVWVFDGACEP